jgi:hypothetical protein
VGLFGWGWGWGWGRGRWWRWGRWGDVGHVVEGLVKGVSGDGELVQSRLNDPHLTVHVVHGGKRSSKEHDTSQDNGNGHPRS